ncbi:lysine N(6)-hydroxylase/L-ornithine N(5)-oxygenase family protein [Guptibacillus hwajinpoensis]|uniref:lysine N(6)-hydroxylase/L-ornithine N(5)-oxygenase family protein n=1 Tax=Guptibacillus hwajinpoensis TaxID=208199 RepID=UPI001CD3B83E|nr:SidA/IucD/PvdA family monooxygenase [Pseudalkalibacillus hwajinpoensis]
MDTTKQYDLVGIGIGPFNLGMAALADESEVDAIYFDQKEEFNWHPGMLIDGADLQVPFLADLVTIADPKSPYTFINYLHEHDRLYQFYFFNKLDIPRKEYNAYTRWVASKLSNCFFGKRVIDVNYAQEKESYNVTIEDVKTKRSAVIQAKHVVLGTGSVPNIPQGFESYPLEDVLHTNHYLFHEKELKKSKSVTVVGSGQSAAEVFYDLLHDQERYGYQINWLTRSAGFFQLESAKLGQEVFSPDYVSYFHGLSFNARKDALSTLGTLRKGIDPSTLKNIYHLLYHRSSEQPLDVMIQPLAEVNGVEKSEGHYELSCRQWQEDNEFEVKTEKIVLATGYKPHFPEWFKRIENEIEWEDEKRFKVERDQQLVFKDGRVNHIFSLTNLDHSHGTGATNLALSVERNKRVLNAVAGKSLFKVNTNTVFQQFSSKDNNKLV